MGYGASYLRGGDPEAQQWMQIAGMAKVMGNEFENDSASRGAAALMRGESLPEGMSEGARNKAYLEAPKLEEGAVLQRKNEFLKQAEDLAKQGNTTTRSVLMNPPDGWFKDTIGFKAYAGIGKELADSDLSTGKAMEAYTALSKAKFRQFDEQRTVVKNALANGDTQTAVAGLRSIVDNSPVNVRLGDYDEKSGMFDTFATDIEKGELKNTGQKRSMDDVVKEVLSVTPEKLRDGAVMSAYVAMGENHKSMANPDIYKDKTGSQFRVTKLINPGTITDISYHVRDMSGKTVGSFSDPSKLADMGLTPYDQKFEEGEKKIRYMDEDQQMQRESHKATMRNSDAAYEWGKKSHAHQEDYWKLQEDNIKSQIEARGAKALKRDSKEDDAFYKDLFSTDEKGVPVSFDDMKIFKEGADPLRDSGIVDDRMLAPLIKEIAPKAKAAVESGAAKSYKEAFSNLAASKLGIPAAELDLITSPEARKMKPEELQATVMKLRSMSAENMKSGMATANQNSLLDSAFNADNGAVSNFMDTILPDIVYDKQGRVDDIIADIGMKLNIDKDQAIELYRQYEAQHQPKTIEQIASEVQAKKEAQRSAEEEDRIKRNTYLGKPTYGSLGKPTYGSLGASSLRNGLYYKKDRGAEL